MPIQYLGQGNTWRAAAIGPLLLTRWLRPASAADFDALESVIRPYIAIHGTAGQLTIVDALDFRPKPEIRPRVEKFACDLQPVLLYSSVVFRCNPVAKIMIYAILNTVTLIARPPRPTTVHGSVAQAIEWHFRQDPRLSAHAPLEHLVVDAERFCARQGESNAAGAAPS